MYVPAGQAVWFALPARGRESHDANLHCTAPRPPSRCRSCNYCMLWIPWPLEPPCLATRASTCTDVLHVFAYCTVSASRRAQGIHIFSDGTLWTLEKTVFAVRSPHWAVGAVVARSAETSRPQVRERQARILSRRAQHRGRPWCRK